MRKRTAENSAKNTLEGRFVDSNLNWYKGISLLDSMGEELLIPRTAFGELLVGQLHPIFQGSFEYTVDNTDLNTNTTAGGGTVTQASGMAVVGTSATVSSTALFQSKQHARYRAGLGGHNRFTALFTTGVAGTEQFVGILDEAGSSESFKNGYAVGYDGATFGYHRFRNDSKTSTAQADWNVDNMSGAGGAANPSGLTLDTTKLNVFFIAFQYLGAGGICLFVENPTTGMPLLVNVDEYANQNTEPSVHNPNFFHTIWTSNGTTTNNIITKSASYAYFIEGKTDFIELHQPIQSSGVREKTSVTTEVAIFTIRNKSSYASKTNFIDIAMLRGGASIEASSANNLGQVRIIKNTTLGGTPSYSDINTSNSVVEIDTSGTTVTGGTDITAALLAGKNDKFGADLIEDKIILNPSDTLTVAGLSANSATIDAFASWKELF